MSDKKYVIGIDYGTDSVRSIIVDSSNGTEISSSVYAYKQWAAGKFCDSAKNQFRQHPVDYIEGLTLTVKEALQKAPQGTAENISGISIDTTGSTPVAVDKNGVPLALTPGFEDNPNAMFILWKDHTAIKEADEINKLAKTWGGEDFTKYVGGIYSSEWFWAKILHVLRNDSRVRDAAYSWMEHCDWLPALLTGNTDPLTIKRSRCAAGHKAMWHATFEGLPFEEFLVKLDPLLKGLRERLFSKTWTCDEPVGTLCSEWAEKLGLSTDVVIGVGAFDAHMGAVGGEIEPYVLTKIVGTSTCDMLIAPNEEFGDKLVNGICGQVDGSIVPGMLGMEAGQSCVGDVYAWFRDILMWPVENIIGKNTLIDADLGTKLVDQISDQIIPMLSEEAEKLDINESGIVALDWLNGRRTPDANQALKGAIIGLSLGSDAVKIFRALVEATAFGAKKIADRFIDEGVKITSVIALGGVAKKSPLVMQIHADVLNMPIKIARSEQTCALGAAMCAATVAGVYENIEQAQKAMGSGFEKEYQPIPENVEKYKSLFEKYSKLGDLVEKELTE